MITPENMPQPDQDEFQFSCGYLQRIRAELTEARHAIAEHEDQQASASALLDGAQERLRFIEVVRGGLILERAFASEQTGEDVREALLRREWERENQRIRALASLTGPDSSTTAGIALFAQRIPALEHRAAKHIRWRHAFGNPDCNKTDDWMPALAMYDIARAAGSWALRKLARQSQCALGR
jgi:hypothetical protein